MAMGRTGFCWSFRLLAIALLGWAMVCHFGFMCTRKSLEVRRQNACTRAYKMRETIPVYHTGIHTGSLMRTISSKDQTVIEDKRLDLRGNSNLQKTKPDSRSNKIGKYA